MYHVFTLAEFDKLRRIAKAHDNKPSSCDKKVSKKEGYVCHLDGLMVEAALSRHYQVPFRARTLKRGDKHAPDLIIYGYGVEVKAASYWPPILKFNALEEFPESSDLAILGYVSGMAVSSNWMITRADFMKRWHSQDFGFGPKCCMRADDMLPLSWLAPPQAAREQGGSGLDLFGVEL